MAGTRYRVDFDAIDPDSDAVSWLLTTGPDGAVLDPATGVLVWTPREDQIGTHELVILATDPSGGTDTARYLLTARGVNVPPNINSTPHTVTLVDEPYSYAVVATDVDDSESQLTYTLVSGPEWLEQDEEHPNTFNGTPTETTTEAEEIVIEVTDSAGNTTTQHFQLQVTDSLASVNLPPTILSDAPSAVVVNDTFRYEVLAIDPENDDITYSVEAVSGLSDLAFTDNVLTFTAPSSANQTFSIQIQVQDENGNSTWQRFLVTTASSNDPPSIVFDPDLVPDAIQGTLFQYRVLTVDIDPLTYSIDVPEGLEDQITIDRYGLITWQVPADAEETDIPVTVHVTDTFGEEDNQLISLRVVGDEEAPHVGVIPSQISVAVGSEVRFIVSAWDNVGIEDLTLAITDLTATPNTTETLAISANGLARTSNFIAGHEYSVVATASDAAAHTTTSDAITLTAYDPATQVAPLVTIESPEDNVFIDEDTSVSVTISDDESIVSYSLTLYPAEGGPPILLAGGAQEEDNAEIATISPVALSDGVYTLVLSATDNDQLTSVATQTITVKSTAKLGNFALSFTDLSIPLAGIPVTIVRQYDTLQADVEGDFGFGWSLGVFNAQLQTDAADDFGSFTDLGFDQLGYSAPLRNGTRISIRMPDGSNEKFTVEVSAMPSPYGGAAGVLLGMFANLWDVKFVPDNSSLQLDVTVPTTVSVNEFGELETSGLPYNPANIGADYRLTTADGTQWLLDGRTGKLKQISDRVGDTISVAFDGIIALDPSGKELARITFEREGNHITRVIDPAGNEITYGYDEQTGDLISVTNRVNQEVDLAYNLDAEDQPIGRPHFLTRITNAENDVVVLQAQFDQGRLSALTDASGASADFAYTFNLGGGLTVESVEDAFDIPTEMVHDANGNIVRRIRHFQTLSASGEHSYEITLYLYDSHNHQTHSGQSFIVTDTDLDEADATRFDYEPETPIWDSITTYDDFGNVTTATDALGNVSQFTYDRFGNVLTSTDPLGNTTTNSYDSRTGSLLSTTDALGNKTSFTYVNGHLHTTADALGRTVATYDYNSLGQMISVTDAASISSYFMYDAEGNQTHSWRVSQGKTFVSVTSYDAEGRSLGSAQFVLDDEFDGSPDSRDSIALACSTDIDDWDDSPAGLQSFSLVEYSLSGQVIRTTDRLGAISESRYDVRGNLVESRSQTKLSNGDTGWIVTRTAYDDNGRAIASTDPLLYTDASGDDGTLLNPATEAAAGSDTSFLRVSHTIYDNLGRVIETRRLKGVTIGIEENEDHAGLYDSTFSTGYTLATALIVRSTTHYDEAGRVDYTISNITTADDSTGVRSDMYYDGAGRTIATLGPATTVVGLNGGDPVRPLTQYVYDAAGRQTSVTGNVVVLDSTTNFSAHPDLDDADLDDSNQQTTTFMYDDRGRQTRTIFANGTSTQTGYNSLGQRVSATDQLGRTTNYEYDLMGRLTSVTLPAVADAENSGALTRPVYTYGYDASGNQTSIIDPKGHVTTFTYNEKGQQTGRTLPGDQSDSTTYDSLGRVTRSVDLQGRVTDYAYDDSASGDGRLLSDKHASNLTNANAHTYARTLAYSYDGFGRVIGVNDSVDGVTANHYDADGRLTQVDRSGATDGSILNHEYNSLGQLTRTWTSTTTAGTGKITETTYGYDPLGRMSGLAQTWRDSSNITDEETDYTYDAAGRLQEQVSPNGVVALYSYDSLNRLVSLKHFIDADHDGVLDISGGGEVIVGQFTYTLDDAGNRLTASESFDDNADGTVDRQQTFAWAYDNLNRLTQETYDLAGSSTDDYITRYTFDLSSNRKTMATDSGNASPGSFSADETITYTYNSNDQLLTEDSTDNSHDATYTYNDGGDQVTKTSGGVTQHYTYDVMSRMTGVDTDGDNTADVTYAYDHTGVRVRITQGTNVTNLVIDALNPTGYTQVQEERNSSGGVTKTYTLGMDILAQVVAGTTPTIHRFLYDGHGSTRGLLNASGHIVEHYTYSAYGILLKFTGTPLTNLLYSGECRDGTTGLDLLRNRWLQPSTGTFTQVDRFKGIARDPISLHKFLYASDNPIMGIDPSGHMTLLNLLATSTIIATLAGILVPTVTYAVSRMWMSDRDWGTLIHAVLGAWYKVIFSSADVVVNRNIFGKKDRSRPDIRFPGTSPMPWTGEVYEMKKAPDLAAAQADLAFYIPRLYRSYPTVAWHAGTSAPPPPSLPIPGFPFLTIDFSLAAPGCILWKLGPNWKHLSYLAAASFVTGFVATFTLGYASVGGAAAASAEAEVTSTLPAWEEVVTVLKDAA